MSTEQVAKIWLLPFAIASIIFKVQKDQVDEISNLKEEVFWKDSHTKFLNSDRAKQRVEINELKTEIERLKQYVPHGLETPPKEKATSKKALVAKNWVKF